MSRRKHRPLVALDDGTIREGAPGTDQYDSDKATIGIGCTGRGSHKRIIIGTWDVLGDLTLSDSTPVNGDDETFNEDLQFVHLVGAPKQFLYIPAGGIDRPHATQPIRCGSCGRDMPILQSKLYRRLRVLKAHGVSFLDLSALDAIVSKQ